MSVNTLYLATASFSTAALICDSEHKHDNFLDSLETALERQDAAKAIDRKRQVHDLLTNANKLLEIYKAADDGVVAAFGGQSSLEDLQRKHEADAQRVKGVLQVGKRICAGELETVEQRGRAKEGIERDEVLEQAAGTFGAPQKGGNEDVERTLGCVERGVKRMLKGTE